MDLDLKKQVLRKLTYGMWVLASGTGDDLEASSVTWIMQASIKPPLVALGIKSDGHLAAVVKRHRAFTLHLLSADQQDLAAAFIKPTVIAPGTIAGIPYSPSSVVGMPLLAGFSAWLECRVQQIVEPGDHTVVVAEVVGVGATDPEVKPFTLAQANWHYGG